MEGYSEPWRVQLSELMRAFFKYSDASKEEIDDAVGSTLNEVTVMMKRAFKSGYLLRKKPEDELEMTEAIHNAELDFQAFIKGFEL